MKDEESKKPVEVRRTSRRHASMVVQKGKEMTKWMQEFSGFNLQNIQENLLE